MRVVIAPDKFRGSLTASEAAKAMARGVACAAPMAVVDLVPLADGGEGIDATLVEATGGTWLEARVRGPLGEPIRARFGLLGDGRTAVVAMAAASGLSLLPVHRRDPTRTSTHGTGDLLLAAAGLGVDRLIVGIGGSATNDGGVGMAQALGYRCLDVSGNELGPGGGALGRLARIDSSALDPALRRIKIEVAADVANPLCGPQGASQVYASQKGATSAQVIELDRNLAHLARVIRRDLGSDILDVPGGGAAGGLGAGLLAFTGATLRPGIELVIDAVGLPARLTGASLCLTGEGCLDSSTAAGKTVVGVAQLARSLGVPTIALTGTVLPGAEQTLAHGVTAYFSICPGPVTLDAALGQADTWLATAADQAVRLFMAGTNRPGAS